MVLADMRASNRVAFGSHPIHALLLRRQLDELLKLDGSLLNETNFVNTYLSKLMPPVDVDWENDLDARQRYLDEVWRFVSRLSEAHNSLKAHVLYHRLALDVQREQFDKERLLTYLQLPRGGNYINPRFLAIPENRRSVANLEQDFRGNTGLPPVGNDESVVRAYLQHFFVDAASYKEFQQYVRDDYLKQLFAETKIINGLGDPEQWASMLTPEAYQQLRERVDLEFAATNPRNYTSEDDVALDVFIKNVPNLIIKVYRVNALNYYQDLAEHVNTSINLDGLVANREVTQTYQESPFRRVRRHLTFPELTDPGVYVIDLIGNGKSSRALIHKGQLRHLVQPTSAGYAFTVLDEQDHPLRDARIWMAGTYYSPQANGQILIPYSTEPRQQPIVLVHDQLASLETFQHGAESYQLLAGIHVDREALRSRQMAPVLIRPELSVSGVPISLAALENPRLEITSVDFDGIKSTDTISNLTLHDDLDLVHNLRVPPRLSELTIVVKGQVKSLSENKTINVQAAETFYINDIERTRLIDQVKLVSTDSGYVLELFGKTGEIHANRPVRVSLKHRDFRQPIDVALRSDETGQIHLGTLPEIVEVKATLGNDNGSQWTLETNRTQYDREIHAVVGDVIEIPVADPSAAPQRNAYSLLERRGSTFVEDHFERLSLRNGALVIEDLAAGDFDLQLKSTGTTILLRVVDGTVQAQHGIGKTRVIQLGNEAVPRIAAVDIQEDQAIIQLAHVTPRTRVHVMADYFHPAFDPYNQLAHVGGHSLQFAWRSTLPSLYVQGRTIGDELRYILERKYATKFPGNMLSRPQLLLNPWDVRDTQTGQEILGGGTEFAAEAPATRATDAAEAQRDEASSEVRDFANLDFLATAAFISLNLKPDADGKITVDLKELAGRTALYVVAVDQQTLEQRTVFLPAADREQIDLRLANGLDPERHFALVKQISSFDAGQTIRIESFGSGRFQLYDSLPRVYQLYETLLPDSHLKDFRFLLQWYKLTADEKRENYSKFACHELNFFLAHHDPEFFRDVVQPYLRHKFYKTFLDRYLLEENLSEYLSPWQYEQLNAVERILLAQRIDGELVRTLDSLRSQWELIPTDQDNLNHLFDTGLLGQALDAEGKSVDKLGLAESRARFGRRAGIGLKYAPPAAATNAGRPAAAGQTAMDERGGAALEKAEADGTVRLGDRVASVDFFAQRQQMVRERFFQTLDQTKEWAENNYYRLPIDQQNAKLITVNDLWLDWAQHGDQPAFRSTNFAQVRNFTEAMFALALLDLPNESPDHQMEVVNQAIKIQTAGPVIVLHEQIEVAREGQDVPPVLVSQNFFRENERYATINGEPVDRFISGEFLYQTVYGCQLVITNPTSSRQKLDVLTQLPTGALPVEGGKTTQTIRVQLDPYRTQTIEYYFYFPAPGDFVQFPAHVTQDGQLVAAAQVSSFQVVEQLSDVDRQSWDYVSQFGSDEDVMQFLQQRNLQEINLDRIAFRMGDKNFFQQTLDTLRQRHIYNHTLWAYAVHHNQPTAIGEFLDHADGLLTQCGDVLISPLVTIDPVARKTYEHLEYYPMVNARAHQIGQQRQIFNDRLYEQYNHWLKLLSYLRQLNDDSRLATVYYLLLQDRVEEAVAQFQQIDRYHITAKMQYDYCQAYLSMSQGETDKARSIALAYEDFPVDRWRNMFATVINHVNEIEGQTALAVDATDRNQSQDELAAANPTFDFTVEAKQLRLQYRNLNQVTVRYYLMDIELLFSRNPFVQRHQGQFSYIAPNLTEIVELPGNEGQIQRELPAELLNQNVLIEIEAGGQRQSHPYYSNAISVQIVENYGQLRISHSETRDPVSTVYCKVYALMKDGRTVFYKDGYTDLRGRFDYATLSTNQLDSVERFAILVLSEHDGATVREVAPPKR